ncbi:MAG TPA: hypothetical protein VF173_19770 [Thermoanaerobaculia bacterium]|nr:hypothetical protein [Thermoanaerobaculia bacterium]
MNTIYTYDDPLVAFSKGRLTRIARPDATISYRYDRFGRRLQDGELAYTWDAGAAASAQDSLLLAKVFKPFVLHGGGADPRHEMGNRSELLKQIEAVLGKDRVLDVLMYRLGFAEKNSGAVTTMSGRALDGLIEAPHSSRCGSEALTLDQPTGPNNRSSPPRSRGRGA